MKSLLLFIILLISFQPAFSQKKNEAYQLTIKKATSAIVVDGVADEQAWADAETAGDFSSVLPMDTSLARTRTEVKMTYDETHIYLTATCYDLLPGPNYVESMKRDYMFSRNDNFLVFIDTFDDQINGFTFGTNAVGAQWDGIIYEGERADLSWDNKWSSVVKNDDDKYVFEMALPFKSIRYKAGITQWGINFSRLDLKTTEKSAWAPVPRQFPTSTLAYSGILVWDQSPPTPKTNISVIPYLMGGVTKDFANDKKTAYRGDIGADAKIAVTSSLNLDLTINPDFSQVDVDQQVTNLDRFELFFPERRQFFLENGDLFANFGYSFVRPFFSRRIGLGVPIQLGARLSGKLDRNWRIGLMDIQTEKVESTGQPSQNFAVVALQRRVFARSNIGLLLVNKQAINYTPDPASPAAYTQYNRNIGLEYNLASANNLWTGKALFLKSFTPGVTGRDFTQAANLEYSSRRWNVEWQHEYVGENYRAEAGFVPRTNFIRFSPEISYNFFSKGNLLLTHGPGMGTFTVFRPDFRLTDNSFFMYYFFRFRTQEEFIIWRAFDYVELLSPFDPTNSRKAELPTGSKHQWRAWGTEFGSRPQSVFTYGFETRYGGYYANGTRLNLTSELGYRFQPYVKIALSSSYNKISLGQPWNNTVFWLIGPRLDVTLTNKLYITGFMQYNDQQQNVNLNARLQWRYAPASDLFVVYTDNYLPSPFNVKNRALIVKLTYWWNI